MSSKFSDFLGKFKCVEKGTPITHTSISNPKASYNIRLIEDYDKLFELYNEYVFLNKKQSHLTEKPNKYRIIIYDIDLKYETNVRQYNDEMIRMMNDYFIKLYSKAFGVQNIEIYIFERDSPYPYRDIYKDGIHIAIPSIVVDKETLDKLRKDFIKWAQDKKIFDNMGLVDINCDSIIDKAVCHNNWFLYGAGKPNIPPYRLTQKYDKNNNLVEKDKDDVHLIKKLSIGYPRLPTSIIYEPWKKNENKTKILQTPIYNSMGEYNIEEITYLVDLINDKRADDYFEWISVGMCLHNINSNDELLNVWKLFSQRSDKYMDGECERKWISFKDDGLTKATLYWMAKKDSPMEYEELIETSTDGLIEQLIDFQTHRKTADILKHLFPYQYKCTNKNKWYVFDNHKWKENEDGHDLSEQINNKLENLLINFKKRVDGNEYKPQISIYGDKHRDLIKDLRKKLQTNSFKTGVIKEAGGVMKDFEFEGKLNKKNNLICFLNGVYDLSANVFRDGEPEDYSQICTKINYIDYSEDHESFDDLNQFLCDVLPEMDIREYVLKYMASTLIGDINEQYMMFWLGSGRNGKSKLIELAQDSFGQYSTIFKMSFFSGKRIASSAASPDLMTLEGKRFASIQEPNGDEEINVGVLKEIIGGDKQTGRKLYGEPTEFTPTAKFVIGTNILPKISAIDDGTWRRIRVVTFNSKFVDVPTEKYHKKIDRNIKDKFPKWKELFMSLLINVYWPKYKKYGLINEPSAVVEATREYEATCNVFNKFIHENIVTDPDHCIQYDKMIEFVYVWYNRFYGETEGEHSQKPKKKDLIAFFDDKWGKPVICDGIKVYEKKRFADSSIAIANNSSKFSTYDLIN